jgi:hypothetical protein
MRWPSDSSSQLCEYVAKLCVVGAARCKSGAISFSESLDEGIAALAANLTILLAVSHNCHCDLSLRLRSACAHSSLAIRAAASGSSTTKLLRHLRSGSKQKPRLCTRPRDKSFSSTAACNACEKNRRDQRICKADIAPVDVSQAYREWVSSGGKRRLHYAFGRFGFYVACAIAASARRLFVRVEKNVIC